jgi:hypothetical protein
MIYVIKHKPYNTAYVEGYEDLNVGALETLAKYNPCINELTGLYEIWKKPDKYKGLVHYRRFFIEGGEFLTLTRAKEILCEYDVITTVDYEPQTPLRCLLNNLDNDLVGKYVSMLPDECINFMATHHAYNICNMFVSKREFIDSYCEWLFPKIIPLCEQFMKEDLTGDTKRNRTIGFIGEILFGYWCSNAKRYRLLVKDGGIS